MRQCLLIEGYLIQNFVKQNDKEKEEALMKQERHRCDKQQWRLQK